MSARFVAVPDLHLDKRQLLDMFGDSAWDLQLEPVHEALGWAVAEGIPRAVFLGDVFHRPRPSLRGMVALVQLMSRFDGKLDMHFLTGNHDVESADKPHSLSLFERLEDDGKFDSVHVHSEPFDDRWDGVDVRICPWGYGDPGNARLCFGHFARPGSVRDNGYPVRGQEHGDKDVVDEQEGDVLWVSGHLHTAQKVGRTYFPGTIYQTSFGEADRPRSVLHASVRVSSGKLKARIAQRRIRRPFRLGTVEISDDSGWSKPLPRSRRQRFRVLHSAELRQPDSYLVDNPAVVECRPVGGSRSHAADLRTEVDASDSGQLEYDIRDRLAELLSGWGLDAGQVARAQEIVDEIAGELGL